MIKNKDILWKGILEEVFDDFLRFFFPDADDIFDMERGFEFLDKELEQLYPNQDNSNLRFVDKLVKVFTKENTEKWILVHIEVQGYKDKDFGERMFTYYYRILDKYSKPITAFAIFTDSNINFHPQSYENSFLGTRLLYEYNSYKILEQNEEELLRNKNPFAIVILVAKAALLKGIIKEEELFALKFDLVKKLLEKQISKEKIQTIMDFLRVYVRFNTNDDNLKFDREIELITEKNTTTMGIRELIIDTIEKESEAKGEARGEAKGIKKKDLIFVNNLLENTDFSNEKIASLAVVDVEFVENQRQLRQ